MGAAGQKRLEMMRAAFDKEAGRMLKASGVKNAPTLAEFIAARDAGPDALAALIAQRVPQAAADVAIGAAAQGNETIVLALLAHPGLISPTAGYSQSGMTLLHAAAQGGLVEIARQMIAQGADVNASIGDWTPLHAAARNGGGEIVAMLLENGARIDAKTHQGVTPLMLAPQDSEAARLLRAAGATM
jgi:ankyrin